MSPTLKRRRSSVAVLQQLRDSAPLGTVSPSNSPPPGPDPLPAPLRGSVSRGFHAGRDIFAKSRSTWPRVQRVRPLVQEMLRTRVCTRVSRTSPQLCGGCASCQTALRRGPIVSRARREGPRGPVCPRPCRHTLRAIGRRERTLLKTPIIQ